ncbi:hypothetical protein HMPREF1869_01417 [Bacteroidales bacterium KA00251]|nr:hypothetical protein HMPREF1869_01417 [Bacteroidales bacterium KA00251]
MEANSNDNYVLVLEDRTEVKNQQEAGKLSVVSGIDSNEWPIKRLLHKGESLCCFRDSALCNNLQECILFIRVMH